MEIERYFEMLDGADPKLLPRRATAGSAGYDFFLPHDIDIEPHSYSEIIWTNVRAKIPRGEFLALYIRSSLGIKKHVYLANSVGVIDSDYFGNVTNNGNIGAVLYNNSDKVVSLKAGDAFMQGIFTPYKIVYNDRTGNNASRIGGMGSTTTR